MNNKKHIIIYSHGFAVRKDDNGLFTEIAASLPEVESVLFDYYQVDETNNKIFVSSFTDQIEKLRQVVKDIVSYNPGAIVDLIGHSQGTIVAAMARPNWIRKAILLAPVFDTNLGRTLNRYKEKSGAIINLDGISEIPSSTGLAKIIPKEYWQERELIKPFVHYNALANKSEIIFIQANQDELLPKTDLSELDQRTKLIAIDGNHNFSQPNRDRLIETIRELLLR